MRNTPATEGQKSEMLSLIYDARLGREAVETLLEAGDLLVYLRRFAGMGLQPEVYNLPPRKGRTIQSMIFGAKFDFVDNKVYEAIKDVKGRPPKICLQARLYRHPEELTPEEMTRRTKGRRLSHLTLADLLLLHEALPDLLRTMSIAALGSLVNIGGHDHVPMLHHCLDESQLIMLDLGPCRKISAGLPMLVG